MRLTWPLVLLAALAQSAQAQSEELGRGSAFIAACLDDALTARQVEQYENMVRLTCYGGDVARPFFDFLGPLMMEHRFKGSIGEGVVRYFDGFGRNRNGCMRITSGPDGRSMDRYLCNVFIPLDALGRL
jgi:hypothetical protein